MMTREGKAPGINIKFRKETLSLKKGRKSVSGVKIIGCAVDAINGISQAGIKREPLKAKIKLWLNDNNQ